MLPARNKCYLPRYKFPFAVGVGSMWVLRSFFLPSMKTLEINAIQKSPYKTT